MAIFDGYCSRKPEGGKLQFSPSGHCLAFLSDDGGIWLWNGFNGKSIASLSYESEMHYLFIFSHSARLAALTVKGPVDKNLTLWNSENGQFIGVAMDVGWDLAISDASCLIATGGGKKEVWLWGGNSLSLVDTLEIGGEISSLAFSHDMLAVGSDDKLTLYDLQTRVIVTSLNCPTPFSLTLSPNRVAAIAGDFNEVCLWDAKSMVASASSGSMTNQTVTALAFSPDCL